MSMSKFKQLEQILDEDFKSTYDYLNRNFEFIRQFAEKLADYLGCDLDKLSCIDSEGKRTSFPNFIQDLITVDDECFFNFRLLVSIANSPFNKNSSGESFVEKGLAPLSGVVLFMAVKLQGDSFIVKTPAIVEEEVVEKEIMINPNIDDAWTELLELCFQVMKKMIEGGLQERIRKLGAKTVPQRAIGFI